MTRHDWQSAIQKTLKVDIRHKTRVGGGDFAQAFRVTLASDRVLFVKTHDEPPAGFFTTEAAGLLWLHDAMSVAVPKVLHVSDDPPCLALEWIERGRGRPQPFEDQDSSRGFEAGQVAPAEHPEAIFGRALANLHAAGAESFGREDARTTGSLAVPNDPVDDWPGFYAERRLLPLARLASDRGALPATSVRRLERLALCLDQFGASDERPSRLHGDLWAGNRIIDYRGQSWLVDPAAHGGHREFDLAMMRLFGGFDEHCHAAYREVSPLAPEWQSRIPLHQLAPLVVHAIKFGGGYVRGVAGALDACI